MKAVKSEFVKVDFPVKTSAGTQVFSGYVEKGTNVLEAARKIMNAEIASGECGNWVKSINGFGENADGYGWQFYINRRIASVKYGSEVHFPGAENIFIDSPTQIVWVHENPKGDLDNSYAFGEGECASIPKTKNDELSCLISEFSFAHPMNERASFELPQEFIPPVHIPVAARSTFSFFGEQIARSKEAFIPFEPRNSMFPASEFYKKLNSCEETIIQETPTPQNGRSPQNNESIQSPKAQQPELFSRETRLEMLPVHVFTHAAKIANKERKCADAPANICIKPVKSNLTKRDPSSKTRAAQSKNSKSKAIQQNPNLRQINLQKQITPSRRTPERTPRERITKPKRIHYQTRAKKSVNSRLHITFLVLKPLISKILKAKTARSRTRRAIVALSHLRSRKIIH